MITDDEDERSEAHDLRLFTINEGGSSISESNMSNITAKEAARD